MMSSRLFWPKFIFALAAIGTVTFVSNAIYAFNSNASLSQAFTIFVPIFLLMRYSIYLKHACSLKFPGPIPVPVLGTMYALGEKTNVQLSLRAMMKKYGNIIDLLFADGERWVLVNDGKAARSVMKSTDRGHLNKDWEKNFRKRLIWQKLYGKKGLDVFSRTKDIMDWKSHRRLLQNAFDQKHVRSMIDKVELLVRELVEEIPSGQKIDILPFLKDLGLNVMYETSLGGSVRDDPNLRQFLTNYFEINTSLFQAYMFDPFVYISYNVLPRFGYNTMELECRKFNPIFRQHCRDLILREQDRQRVLDKEVEVSSSNMMTILVSHINDDDFTVENVIDELLAFIFAGFDTTSATVGSLLFYLASHPHEQQRVHEELDNLTQNSDNKIYADLLPHSPYLSACIREAMRLQPVASMLTRRLESDVSIVQENGTKIRIPEGDVVALPIHTLHYNEEIYPQPEAFKPERWIDASTGGLKPVKQGYYFAFGAGPKMCIGYQLAEKEVKMAAIGFLQKFSMKSYGDLNMVDKFSISPEKVVLEFERRI